MKATYAPYLFWLAFAAAGLSACSAHAAEGRIVFSGAIVEPTCPSDAAAVIAISAPTVVSVRRICGARPGDPGRSYTRTVLDLDASLPTGDRLLGYFARYTAVPGSGGATRARLVIRTYD